MNKFIRSPIGNALAWVVLVLLLAYLAVWACAPRAHADGVDCYTQTTHNGSRTTCYYGYPNYQRTITDCDASRCVTRVQ